MVSDLKKFDKPLSDQFPVLYQHRYCEQEDFFIGVFSNDNYGVNVLKHKHFLLKNFDKKVYLPNLPIPKYDCRAVASSSTIYVTDKVKDYNTFSVVKYSFSTKTWNKLPL